MHLELYNTHVTYTQKFLETNFNAQIVIPELAKEIGLEESLVIQQLHYWIQRCGKIIDGNIWVYNTFVEWGKQFSYISISTIKRIFYSLEKKELIFSSKFNACKSNHTKWYAINYPKFLDLLKEILPEKNFDSDQLELSLAQFDTINNSITNTNKHNNNFLSYSRHLRKQKKIERKNFINKIKENYSNYDTKSSSTDKVDKKVIRKSLSKEEQDICEDMFLIWNKIFINQKDKVIATEVRSRKLITLWEKLLNKDLKKWEELCIKINSSKFLMGEKKEGFKAYFDWIICEITASRIIQGDFGVGDRIPDLKAREANRQKEEYLQQLQKKQNEQLLKEKTEILARDLKQAALNQLKQQWSRSGEQKARKVFEEYMLSDKNDYKFLENQKQNFRKNKWGMTFVELYFDAFILSHYLQKTEGDFLDEAKQQIIKNINYISMSYNNTNILNETL